MNNKNSLFCLLLVYSFATCAVDSIPLLQMKDEEIAQEKARISSDFIKRGYLAKASYTMLAAGTIWFAYKWGLFDYVLGKQEAPAALPKTIADNEKLRPIVKAMLEKININEQKNLEGKAHWFIEGVKYVGVAGFSMLAGIVVQSKWQSLFNYALAEPTFDWFYGCHSMLNRIDSLRYHIANAIDTTGAAPSATLEYHSKAIAPTLETLQANLKELIAFSEYYLDKLDQETVAQYNLDGAARFLFNTSNDFFAALHDALDTQDRAKALALTDAFRAELSNYNKDCQSFENMVLN
ncbi:hypothetical protein BH09DEP1_BH09DEP1_4900 [soil metagenome]